MPQRRCALDGPRRQGLITSRGGEPPRSGHHRPPAGLRSLLEDTTSVKDGPA